MPSQDKHSSHIRSTG